MNVTAMKKVAATIALLVISLITLGSTNSVSAQGRRGGWDRWENRWDRYEDRYEERRGYRDGYDEGRDDARRGRHFDFDDNRRYRNGSHDYREGFRRGYINAFREYRDRRW